MNTEIFSRVTGNGVFCVSTDGNTVTASLAGRPVSASVSKLGGPAWAAGVKYTHKIGNVAATADQAAAVESAWDDIRRLNSRDEWQANARRGFRE